jgi:hypothetical protein
MTSRANRHLTQILLPKQNQSKYDYLSDSDLPRYDRDRAHPIPKQLNLTISNLLLRQSTTNRETSVVLKGVEIESSHTV